MSERIVLGLSSVATGTMAIAAILTEHHLESFLAPGSAVVLDFANRIGLLGEPGPLERQEMKPIGFLPVTDENALRALLIVGMVLAAASLLLALRAERRSENNLYPSVGFICGSMALLLFNFAVGLASTIAGMTALLVIRHSRKA